VRKIKAALPALSVLFLIATSLAKEKPSYLTGKLLDVTVQDVTRGIGIVGSMAAPIPGKLYTFQIQSGGLVYFAQYSAGTLSYRPEWIVNDPIEFRLGKEDKMLLKRPDGKDLEVMILKKVRQQ